MHRFLIAIGLLLLGLFAKAEVKYLYWTVNHDEVSEKTEFAFAQLAVLKDGVQLIGIDPEDGSEVPVYMDLVGEGQPWTPESSQYPYGGAALVGGTFDDPVTGTKIDRQTAVILDEWQGAAYSFQLELYNSEFEKVGPDQVAVSYEELVGAIFEGGSSGADHTWNAIGPAPVPEPTGGTLVLLGFALLGLRRKRFKSFDAMT